MRTAEDFNAYYQTPDPWQLTRAHRRDRALSRIIQPHIEGKRVLELGCGEGHLTAPILNSAKQVLGIDISSVAVERANARSLPNASFELGDFLGVSFSGYDVITAVECLYYLSPDEQDAFFRKLVAEHRGTFIISAPIIGENKYRKYFTHGGLLSTFARYGLSLIEWSNLNAYRKAGIGGFAAAIAARLSDRVLPWLPERVVYQRSYVLGCGVVSPAR